MSSQAQQMKMVVKELASLVEGSQKVKKNRPQTEMRKPVHAADDDAASAPAKKAAGKKIDFGTTGPVKPSQIDQHNEDEFADF
jgi:hypothetical protein